MAMLTGLGPVPMRRYTALLTVVLTGMVVQGQVQNSEFPKLLIEIFVDGAGPVIRGPESESVKIIVYRLAAIERFQQVLSRGLSADPEQARLLVLERLQEMEAGQGSELQQAAQGLVQALRYNLDRYPAIVLDGKAVVYGLTDIEAASRLYWQWQQSTAMQ